MEQSFKNHSRYIPLYHMVTLFLLLLLTAGAFINLFEKIQDRSGLGFALFLVILVIALWLIGFYARAFALRAQDRVIMLEERLRYQQLTGKTMNSKLRPSQIVALRFASDAEFPLLADRAAAENMDSKSIKQAIRQWRADTYRV